MKYKIGDEVWVIHRLNGSKCIEHKRSTCWGFHIFKEKIIRINGNFYYEGDSLNIYSENEVYANKGSAYIALEKIKLEYGEDLLYNQYQKSDDKLLTKTEVKKYFDVFNGDGLPKVPMPYPMILWKYIWKINNI